MDDDTKQPGEMNGGATMGDGMGHHVSDDNQGTDDDQPSIADDIVEVIKEDLDYVSKDPNAKASTFGQDVVDTLKSNLDAVAKDTSSSDDADAMEPTDQEGVSS